MIKQIMNELKTRRDWNNSEEVEEWFEEKLNELKAKIAELKMETINIANPSTDSDFYELGRNDQKIVFNARIDKLLEEI